MKNKSSGKLDSKKILTYTLLFEALLILGVYIWVYQKYTDMTAKLQSDNQTLTTRVAELKEYYDNVEMYTESTKAMKAEIDEKLDSFPADVKEEDVLVLALDTMRKANVGYTGISVSPRKSIYDIDETVVTDAALEGYDQAISMGSRVTQYTTINNYYELKKVVDIINSIENRRVINTLSYTKNDDGYLEGTIEVQSFFAIGTGKGYVAPDIADYEAGLSDLFKISIEEMADTDI